MAENQSIKDPKSRLKCGGKYKNTICIVIQHILKFYDEGSKILSVIILVSVHKSEAKQIDECNQAAILFL